MAVLAGKLIAAELKTKKNQLAAREQDLAKAKRLVTELEGTCAALRTEILDLEHGDRALTRGCVAIMCESSAAERGA